MKNWIVSLFSSKSEVSSMRVMSMIALLTACYIGIRALETNKDISAASILCGTFLGASFAGKSIQKFAEKEENK